jgi:glucuronate isomerase
MSLSQPFLPDDFLLPNPWARRLYFEHAAKQPIFDYHCHLPPDQIAANRQFTNLTQIWLGGDHYKWRALRAAGIPEDLITGNTTSDYDKFLAFARTVPSLVRNPLHHWSHLELRRYFGIDLLINEANAPRIWDQANERLATPALSTHGILTSNRVTVVCTTDDPADTLEHHQAIARSSLATRVYPTFRPDKALAVNAPAVFNPWCDLLSERSGVEVRNLPTLLEALDRRGWQRSFHQRMFHDNFFRACARIFWKREPHGVFAKDHQKILEVHGWDHLSQEVLVSTPRRFGKTISVSMFAAAMLYSCPNLEMSIYSTCKASPIF